ncbi:MAG: alpha/beta hydrolase, partial [Pseudomonadota bacterium]
RPSKEIAATTSAVPTLIIAGAFDPYTPPKWGRKASETLDSSILLVFDGGAHGETQNWSGDGCAMKLAATFFEDPEAFLAKDEKRSCFDNQRVDTFFTPTATNAAPRL